MAVSQNKVVTPQGLASGQAIAITAKTVYTDMTNTLLAFTAGPNGALLFGAKAVPRVTVTATQLMLIRSMDGITGTIFAYGLMTAYTMAPTTLPPTVDFGYGESTPLRFAAGERIYYASAVAFAAGIALDIQAEQL